MGLTAQQITDALIFSECQRQRSLPNLLTGGGPKALEAHKYGKVQSSPEAPVVQVSDLSKTHGTDISVTVIHKLSQKPQMGLEDRDGYEEDITSADFNMKIGQYHHAVRTGLMIEQQQVGYDKKKIGIPLLSTYHGDLSDELSLLHLAGARGTETAEDRILPLAGAELDNIAINPVTAPTFGRKLYCGSATSVDGSGGTTALTSSDTFSPSDTRKFKEYIELMAHPPKPIRLGENDKTVGTDPMYIGFVTPKMWTSFESSSTDFQKNVANALARTKGFNHPLFQGEMFMKDNILFKKYYQPVGWSAGDAVSVCADVDAATESDQTAPVAMQRGIILGGQALAMAYGSVLPGGAGMFKTNGELFQQDSQWRQWMDWIMGLAKIRFEGSSGRIEDNGVIAFDAAV